MNPRRGKLVFIGVPRLSTELDTGCLRMLLLDTSLMVYTGRHVLA